MLARRRSTTKLESCVNKNNQSKRQHPANTAIWHAVASLPNNARFTQMPNADGPYHSPTPNVGKRAP
eukprot:8916064-Lingulodinium_polyedra.AAC.1